MRKVTPITEQLQHFVEELQEGFWGALCGRTRRAEEVARRNALLL